MRLLLYDEPNLHFADKTQFYSSNIFLNAAARAFQVGLSAGEARQVIAQEHLQ